MRLEVRFWIADPMNGVNNVRSDINRAIWRVFRGAQDPDPGGAARDPHAGPRP